MTKEERRVILDDVLATLRVTATNILSLGPAGALDRVPEPYRLWLGAVIEATDRLERVLAAEPRRRKRPQHGHVGPSGTHVQYYGDECVICAKGEPHD